VLWIAAEVGDRVPNRRGPKSHHPFGTGMEELVSIPDTSERNCWIASGCRNNRRFAALPRRQVFPRLYVIPQRGDSPSMLRRGLPGLAGHPEGLTTIMLGLAVLSIYKKEAAWWGG
jgi:hypothetical protein